MAGADGFDRELVEQAKSGDERARARLLARLEPLLRAFFVQRIGHRSEVDDLVQNTLVRIHTGLEDLENSERLKAFSMKAALFELQDYYRGRYHPKERLYDPEFPPDDPRLPDSSGARLDAERALATLSERARRIVELREYGYRYEEIARAIGTTEAAVKMQVKRAFERMRQLLAE